MRSPEIVRRLWGNRVAVGTAVLLSGTGTFGDMMLTQHKVSEELQRVPPSRFQTGEDGPKIITFYNGPARDLTPGDVVTIDISDIPKSSILARAYEETRQERAKRAYASTLQDQKLLLPKATGGIALYLTFTLRFMALASRRRP